MNKGEFISAISEKSGVDKKNTLAVFDAMTKVVCDTLAEGDKIAIAGFGNFETRQRAARTGRNPQTGATVQIPAKRVPAFKPSSVLKSAVLK